jgi:O-antigen/teichoic acid export membrane protein
VKRAVFLPYLVLRGSTAGAALVTGVCQTYVFARVLDPHNFSLFIIIGNLGLSLWLFDLGIAKVLYVNLRARFLDGTLTKADEAPSLGRQAAGVTFLYIGLALLGAAGCFAIAALFGGGSAQGVEFALFFVYAALNLAWFALRNVSTAVDRFLYFESLEALRRILHLALLFALLFGLPFMEFLLASNAVWIVLFAAAIRRLRAENAFDATGPSAALRHFARANRRRLMESGGYAAGEIFVYNYPSLLVPAVMGLGAPTIIFDTAFKIFRGANVLFSAACDLMVPGQTRAFQAGDKRGLWRATAIAAALGAAPALGLCGLLAIWGDALYALLLGNAAQMPSSVTPILIWLIACNWIQTVSNFLLVHTGHFAAIVRAAGIMTAIMAVVAVAAAWTGIDVVRFLAFYAGAYAGGAALYAWLALRLPLALRRAGTGA